MASRSLFPPRFRLAARSRAARHARTTRWAAVIAALAAVALVAGLMPAYAAPAPAHPWSPPPQKFVPVYPVPARKVNVPAIQPWQRPATTWPAAGSATVTITAGGSGTQRAMPAGSAALAAPGPGAVRAGNLPVWVSQPAPLAGQAAPTATAASAVTVTSVPEQAARDAGINGAVFTVARADGQPAADPAHVTVNYSGFAYAYGGNYAARLRLVELPACALTTPQLPACRRQTPLPGGNNVRAGDLGADITVPAATTAAVVLAATAGASGSAGDYTATSLSEAGQWSGGSSNGSFDYSYPIQVPPVPGGLEPDVNLGYSSQSVDGLTSSTNAEASWIGDGWNYSPGFVERSFQSCETKPPGATNWVKSSDFCWSGNDSVTVSLNGQDTPWCTTRAAPGGRRSTTGRRSST